ncbi:MAG: carboxypeptidase regulatory-like domain-containing protein [Chloroflexota bacterium]
MNKQTRYLIFAFIFAVVFFLGWQTQSTKAHGTEITYKATTAIEIEALFDTGEPMANAQVIIYAPNNPETPWLTGEADEAGHFIFSPDASITGRWDVTIRTAGHGEILYIPIEDGTIIVDNGGSDTLQQVLMGAMGLWGFIGTALYFSRRK